MADSMIAPEEILIWGLDEFPEGEDHSDLADPERLALPVSEELIASIDTAGVIRPILVRAVKASIWRTFRKSKNDRAYIAIDGRQCVRAARELNKRRKDNFPVLVPYAIRELSDEIAPLAPGIANAGSQRDTPLMMGQRAARLMARGYKVEQMRHAFDGFPNVQTLRNYLSLLKVVPELQPKLGTEITWSDGYALGRMTPAEQRAKMLAVAAPKMASLGSDSIVEPGAVHPVKITGTLTEPAPARITNGEASSGRVQDARTDGGQSIPRRLPSERAQARPSLAALKAAFVSLEAGEADDPDPSMDLAAEVLRWAITGEADFSRWPNIGERIK